MKSIQSILSNPSLPELSKRLAWEKWKFNQLPRWYRKNHVKDIQAKLQGIIQSYDSIYSKENKDKRYRNSQGEPLPF